MLTSDKRLKNRSDALKLDKSDLQLETIVTRINRAELDLQPNFQRGEIWDRKRRQRLIDTILREWYVPAIHIVVDPDGNESVLDGQQRLATVRSFFADEISVDGQIEPVDETIQSLDGLKYSELPDSVRRSVNRFTIQTIALRDYNPQEPNELFFRLNQAYNLTPPEKRNALHGRARDQVKNLVVQLTADGLLTKEVIGFANGRLAYDDIIARACALLDLDNMRIHITNDVVENYYRDSAFNDKTVEKIAQAGRNLLAQIAACPDKVRFNKGTLQTWIIYCSWASDKAELPEHLLREFEWDRYVIRHGDTASLSEQAASMLEVVRIYDDRGSYRVTDVSSVRARDLAIHLYSQRIFSTPSHNGSHKLLDEIRQGPPESVKTRFFDFIEASDWGNPLSDGDIAG
jgi:hypothetical protein